ncbi:phage tail protein [Massilia sp. TS11]|uniref:phage tail protein n=1 Tax=Massilia sp. TS11 TaxID=2908003 RepID=UPI001EDC21E0|nr:tail fiber protein [Massilia sp. TS11]MCG2585070.1 tail fiber protein [Massilia sp. TS11]
MADNFIGEIRLFTYSNRIPRGWVPCNGQLLPINQNVALYSLLQTQFGGDGKTTFGVPNLQGNVALCANPRVPAFVQGKTGGEETHMLTAAEVPAHTHYVNAINTTGTLATIAGNLPAATAAPAYSTSSNANMAAAAVSTVGGQAHNNMQPFLPLVYCIATAGVFPPRP